MFNPALTPEMKIVRANRSAAIRVTAPKLPVEQSIDEQLSEVKVTIMAARENVGVVDQTPEPLGTIVSTNARVAGRWG